MGKWSWASAVGICTASTIFAGRVWPIVSPASHGELHNLVLGLLLLPALCVAGVLAVVSLALLACGRWWAIGSLLGGLTTIIIYWVPLGPLLHHLDDRLHRESREDVVRQVTIGQLEPLRGPFGQSPVLVAGSGHLFPLPMEYPAAVSGGLSQRAVEVWSDHQSSRVVFFPHGGFRNGHWYIVYQSEDRMTLDDAISKLARGSYRVERLRDHWYRVMRDE